MQKPQNKSKFRNLPNSAFTRVQKFSNSTALGNIAPRSQPKLTNIRSRLLIVWGVLIFAGIGLAVDLYRLQIVQGRKLTAKAREQQMVSLRPFMPRRPVTDRNGNILAVDRPVYTLYVHPKLFNHSYQEVAQLIAPILGRDAGELVKIFESKNSGILLTSNLSESIGDRLIGLNLNGLEFIQKYSRFYPQADLFSDNEKYS
jgi:cell division protein FtsI (penicillin-binding protein 3)